MTVPLNLPVNNHIISRKHPPLHQYLNLSYTTVKVVFQPRTEFLTFSPSAIFFFLTSISFSCLGDVHLSMTSSLLNNFNRFFDSFSKSLSGCGFEPSCSHLKFRFCACLEQGVAWHSGNYSVNSLWNAYVIWKEHFLLTHLVEQKKSGYLLVPVTLSKSSLLPGLLWWICHILFSVCLIFQEIDWTAVFNGPNTVRKEQLPKMLISSSSKAHSLR